MKYLITARVVDNSTGASSVTPVCLADSFSEVMAYLKDEHSRARIRRKHGDLRYVVEVLSTKREHIQLKIVLVDPLSNFTKSYTIYYEVTRIKDAKDALSFIDTLIKKRSILNEADKHSYKEV